MKTFVTENFRRYDDIKVGKLSKIIHCSNKTCIYTHSKCNILKIHIKYNREHFRVVLCRATPIICILTTLQKSTVFNFEPQSSFYEKVLTSFYSTKQRLLAEMLSIIINYINIYSQYKLSILNGNIHHLG